MKIQIYNSSESDVFTLTKNSLILVFNEIAINELLKLSHTHKILIVSENNYYKNLKLNNVYFLNSTNNYLCFNGIVILASTNVDENFINQINKWLDYKLIVITLNFDENINNLSNNNFTYLYYKNINSKSEIVII